MPHFNQIISLIAILHLLHISQLSRMGVAAMTNWNTTNIPPQQGRSAIVTGTGGLGYETALALARAGGDVVLAGRSAAKGMASVAQIQAAAPGARIVFEQLDLASLASVAAFSDRILGTRASLDLLVNNAGVMTPPTRQTTSDGFELQFGTNYLGHFALTARLLPLLQQGHAPRIVNLSSLAHRSGAIQFDDLQWERSYKPWASYAQSKLAMLMFALELQRRSDAAGWGLMSNAAHPGYARTELIANGPGKDAFLSKINVLIQPLISHSAADGALPTLFAATSPDAKGRHLLRAGLVLRTQGAAEASQDRTSRPGPGGGGASLGGIGAADRRDLAHEPGRGKHDGAGSHAVARRLIPSGGATPPGQRRLPHADQDASFAIPMLCSSVRLSSMCQLSVTRPSVILSRSVAMKRIAWPLP